MTMRSHIPLVSRLPESLISERWNELAIHRLARPQERNSLDREMVFGIERVFSAISQPLKATVLGSEADHFCAGLDLNEIKS
jgi:(methylthio)acryloyl-CoA hydratase